MIDQLAESYHSFSPYAYVMNNPVMMTDPDGRYAMPQWIKPMWDQTPNGMNSFWATNGNSFDFKGYLSDSRYSELSMSPNGGGGFDTGSYINIPEVVVTGRKGGKFGAGTYNSVVFASGYMLAQANWNFQQNWNYYYNAEKNSKAAQAANGFYYYFAGSLAAPFVAAYGVTAWSALGSVGGSTQISWLGNMTVGNYLRTSIVKGGMDIFTQSKIKNGDIDYWQAGINGFVPGYKSGLLLNYLNNNKNSWVQGNFSNDFYKNIFKTGVSALIGMASQYGPNVQTHGTALTSYFELWNQGLSNINDKMIDDEFEKNK